jgi:hypothetical protein
MLSKLIVGIDYTQTPTNLPTHVMVDSQNEIQRKRHLARSISENSMGKGRPIGKGV